MISFASERGSGQDLATHLLNVEQNEYVEVAFLRGAVANDLHGAFAEWEVQAKTLTKCKNYLYSMSINPDPEQGPLSRDQYMDYIRRVEEKLGLQGQPSVAVFHIKNGREHCHAVWSKIDVEKEKAVHLAFDHDKLMTVTRQFAKDHNLRLPDGYNKSGRSGKEQVTLYQKEQERISGISREEQREQITEAWRRSDSPKAFIQALAEKGYILARGRRPYVLVDFYGNMNALPKMIDDKTIRTKNIREFLGNDYPSESLPTVDEARTLISGYRKSMEAYFKEEQKDEQVELLKRNQDMRRNKLEQEKIELTRKHGLERKALFDGLKKSKQALRQGYFDEINTRREEKRPSRLSHFFSRVTGINFVKEKIEKYRDQKLVSAYLQNKKGVHEVYQRKLNELQRAQEYQLLDIHRRMEALEKVVKRELKTLQQRVTRETRIRYRSDKAQMPSLNLKLTPRGRPDVAYKAINRFSNKILEAEFIAARDHRSKEIDLSSEFDRVSSVSDSGSAGEGDSKFPRPEQHREKQSSKVNQLRDDQDRDR